MNTVEFLTSLKEKFNSRRDAKARVAVFKKAYELINDCSEYFTCIAIIKACKELEIEHSRELRIRTYWGKKHYHKSWWNAFPDDNTQVKRLLALSNEL
jgi:hypothetical protein